MRHTAPDNFGPLFTDGPRHGATFVPALDESRLNEQARRVWNLMKDGKARTLHEISSATGDPEASVSARLRDFRKDEFGAMTVERRRRGDAERGLFEYRISLSSSGAAPNGAASRSPRSNA